MRYLCIGLLACLAHAALADAPVVLIQPPPLAQEADTLPRLEGTDEAALQINAELTKNDENALEQHQSCLSAGEGSDWGRSTEVTFAGPDFLGLQETTGGYCEGAAHPYWFTRHLTFDLHNGQPFDWRKALPAAYLEPNSKHGVLPRSPALSAIYLDAVSPIEPDCEYELTDGPLTFALWLHTEQRAIAISPTSLSYVGTPCIDIVYLTPTQAQTRGADVRLLAALASANPITTVPAQTSP